MKTSFAGINVYTERGFERSDVLIEDGIVASVSPSKEVSESNNIYLFPGFADVHTHLREPGFSYKEDIASGSAAAAAGGYTDICAMPNLKPVPDSREGLEAELSAIRAKALIRVHPYGSLTVNEEGRTISDLEAMAGEVVAFSDDGKGVPSKELMREAMLRCRNLNKLIAAHCEDMTVIGGAHVHAGKCADLLGIEGISAASEWKMIERDIGLARETGCSYHVCHVSTKESVELIRRAKAEGLDVSCETAPHYLLLDEDDLAAQIRSLIAEGHTREEAAALLGRYKMNPPLRCREDREALVEGLADGTIDMIATDHAPHSDEEKGRGILGGPMGVVGLECAFPVLYTGLVRTGVLSLEELVRKMTDIPRDRFGIAGSELRKDFCIYDLAEEYDIRPEQFATKGRYTPFEKMHVRGRCLMTVCDGRVVYTYSR